ncbi:MAG: hypothetical protein HYU37_14890 [Acidobacteria bacterium]|nr:hypothetical protein [Acidobacteriota bacterium]
MGLVKVPAKPAGLWQLAIEYVETPCLLRLRVVEQDARGACVPTTWRLSATLESSPNGINAPARTGLLATTALRGALIGKVGGSTADIPDSTAPATPYGAKKVFAVGSECMVSLSAGEEGPLYLTMNDSPDSFAEHDGALHVQIEHSNT